jgi:hypothetical protein
MEYGHGILSSTDLSGMKMDDRDTLLMSVGTAFGGMQKFAIKTILNEPAPTSSSDILRSTSGVASLIVGIAFVGVGIGTRLGYINFNKDAATLMLGYGISALISLGLNYVTYNAAVMTSTPRPSQSGQNSIL